MKTAVYNQDGKSTTDLSLDSAIFEISAKPATIAQAIKVQQANARQSIAHTKTRGEVSGGGRKPWKQKGTGNARAGSSRSPLWEGGGITFGPRNARNFKLRSNQKMRNLVIKTLLSDKAKEKKLVVVKDLDLEKVSTKALEVMFQGLPIESGKILVIVAVPNMNLELSAANLPYLKIIKINNLNAVDLMNYEWIVATTDAIKKIPEVLGK